MSLSFENPYSEDDTSVSALKWEELEIELDEAIRQRDKWHNRYCWMEFIALILFLIVVVCVTA